MGKYRQNAKHLMPRSFETIRRTRKLGNSVTLGLQHGVNTAIQCSLHVVGRSELGTCLTYLFNFEMFGENWNV